MRCKGVEEEGIAGTERKEAFTVAIDHAAGQHVDELHAGVTELLVGLGLPVEGDHVWLDGQIPAQRMPEKMIEVSGSGAAPVDAETLSAGT